MRPSSCSSILGKIQLMRLLIFLLALPFTSVAQFIYHPLPVSKQHFTAVSKAGYTRCLMLEDDTQQLIKVAEYNNGLLAVVTEKGINDEGDSINTAVISYTYDAKGRLTKKVDEDIEFGESIAVYQYDAKGRLRQKKVITIDPPTYTYQYDAAGKLTQMNMVQRFPEVDEEGEATGKAVDRPTERAVYKYDAKGRLVEEKLFSMRTGKPEASHSFQWRYDDGGKIIALLRVDTDGVVSNERKYDCNAEGLLVKETVNDNFDGTKVFRFVYDKAQQSWMQ